MTEYHAFDIDMSDFEFAEKITNSDKISDKKMIEYAKAIQDYCVRQGKNENCGNCVFLGLLDEIGNCRLGKGIPEDWQLGDENKNA